MNISSTGKAFVLVKNMLDTTKRTETPIAFSPQKPRFEPSDGQFFQRCTPEECGIESGYVLDYIEKLSKDKNIGLQTVMLIRNSKVFFEASVGQQEIAVWKSTFSECKSVVALAIGYLVGAGKLSLDEKLVDIFSEKTTQVAKVKLKSLTIRHLLTMTSTVTFNEAEAMITHDWVKAFMNSATDGKIGKTFYYNSLNTYMLSAVIKAKTGKGLSQFLDATLFKRLGIKNYFWEKCPLGIEKGGWGLYILPEDVAKLGLLVLHNGIWNGRRLIPAHFIEEATRTQAIAPREYGDYNYGYQIWCGRTVNSFLFNGMLGQNLLCFRDNGVIVVCNCGNGDNFQQNAFFGLTAKYFQKSFPKELENNATDYKLLCRKKEQLVSVLFTPKRSFLSVERRKTLLEADLLSLNGKKLIAGCSNAVSTGFAPLFLQAIQNNYTSGLKSIEFSYKGGEFEVEFNEAEEKHVIAVGFGNPIRGTAVFRGEPFLISSYGVFSENEDGVPVLKITVDFLETPYSRVYKFYFDGKDITAEFIEAPGVAFSHSAPKLFFSMSGESRMINTVFSKLDGDYFTVKLEKAFAPRLTFFEQEQQ